MKRTTEFELRVFLNKMIVHHRGDNPIDRNMMSSDEIRVANKLVSLGKIVKGKTHQGRVNFYYE